MCFLPVLVFVSVTCVLIIAPLSSADKNFFLVKSFANYKTAVRGCERRSAVLASIKSATEQATVDKLIKGLAATAWLGATIKERGQQWTWQDGSGALTYANWFSGQPDSNTDARRRRKCLSINAHNRKWYDVRCDFVAVAYVCHRATQLSSCSSCSGAATKVDGRWCDWKWTGACTVTCGGGLRPRQRNCGCPAPANGGEACPRGPSNERVACNTHECAATAVIHGVWCAWNNVGTSGCSKTCGGGLQNRRRRCECPRPVNGGSTCPGGATESVTCGTKPCVAMTTTPPHTTTPAPVDDTCASFEYRCANSECVPGGKRCNDIYDCFDGSDEENCAAPACSDAVNAVRCSATSDECVALLRRCDGRRDCGDGTDESVGCNASSVCGRPTVPLYLGSTRVIGGVPSANGSLPWTAALYYRGQQVCGAALLNSRWVLTAAHCIPSSAKANPSVLTLKLGKYNLTNPDVAIGVSVTADKVVTHAAYVYPANDIAVIRLSRDVPVTSHVRPVCLPTVGVPVGRKCVAAGWGDVTKTGMRPRDKLMQALVPVIDGVTCNRADWYDGRVRDAIMFCAGFADGAIDTCQGDSGGPLVCKREDGVFEIHGVTSWGSGCAEKNHPGVYTRIHAYNSWITANTQ